MSSAPRDDPRPTPVTPPEPEEPKPPTPPGVGADPPIRQPDDEPPPVD
jgi:hypothetical protein